MFFLILPGFFASEFVSLLIVQSEFAPSLLVFPFMCSVGSGSEDAYL